MSILQVSFCFIYTLQVPPCFKSHFKNIECEFFQCPKILLWAPNFPKLGASLCLEGIVGYIPIVQGCNIYSKTLLAKRGKLPLKFTCPTGTSTCPVFRGYSRVYSNSSRVQHRFQNITCQAWQAAPKVYLPHWHFHLPHHFV